MNMQQQTPRIFSWVFMTNDIVNSEHTMSTMKSVCYIAHPVLVSKCQPRKMVKNVCPSHPHHQPTILNRFYSYLLQLLLMFKDLAALLN